MNEAEKAAWAAKLAKATAGLNLDTGSPGPGLLGDGAAVPGPQPMGPPHPVKTKQVRPGRDRGIVAPAEAALVYTGPYAPLSPPTAPSLAISRVRQG